MSQMLRVGMAGLGGAAELVLPWFTGVEGVVLAGAADIRPEARRAFECAHERPAFDGVEALCASPEVDAVWIETPSALHCDHALTAIANGKHVICAKPLALSVEDCDRMIAAAEAAGVRLMQGHSKVFDPPIRAMAKLAASGSLGRVIQVDILMFNDWLQRPRLEDELDSAKGGGVVLRQGPHLVDIATAIIGAGPRSVRAVAGRWDPNLPAMGNFSALLDFGDGVAASLSLNGYGYFDSTELHWRIGATGAVREPGAAPIRRTEAMSIARKYAEGPDAVARARRATGTHPPFFGLTIVSCERGVIRQSPQGLFVHTATGVEEYPVEPYQGRAAELIELRDALRENRPVFPDGRWGRATLETCLAIEMSSREDRDVRLTRQEAVSPFAKVT